MKVPTFHLKQFLNSYKYIFKFSEIDVPNMSEHEETLVDENKKKKTTEVWEKTEAFETYDEAIAHIKNENTWSYLNKKTTRFAEKTYYRCNQMKRRGKCPAKLYLSCSTTNGAERYMVFENHYDHSHDPALKSNTPLSEEMLGLIKELVNSGHKLMAIRKVIYDKKLEMPSDNQLNGAIRKFKDELKEGFTISIGAIKQFCEDNKKVPYDDHEPFILDYVVSEIDEDPPRFIYMVTTKTLLTNATLLSDHIAIDATYKVVLQDFPLVLIGSNDKWNKYHPFGIALISSEKIQDYEFIFEKFKNRFKDILQVDYDPNTLVADGSSSIRGAFESVFGVAKKKVICFFHMKKCVKDKLKPYEKSIKEKEQVTNILKDIQTLRNITDEDLFPVATSLFKKKWIGVFPQFIEYFFTQWVQKMDGWYLGYAADSPSTNNGTEGKNQSVKEYYTHHLRLDWFEARSAFMNMVQEWSVAYLNKKIETNLGEITKKLKVTALAMAKKNPFKAKFDKRLNRMRFYIGDIDWKDKIKTFDDFKTQHQNIVVNIPGKFDYNFCKNEIINIVVLGNAKTFSWEKGKCSCPDLIKNNICIHILAIGYLYKQVSADSEAMDAITLGAKPKPGRKAKVPGPWLKA